ncbi:ribosomal protein S18 acetylase RimI-like enzyme [Nocardioides daedukensis]|uniref:Ribosomal protein S18 acetylase RimI-like enzyme n=1 Tax=Nocardioides daedukensis TaxID=634462 RepID=A0A7Y9RZX2_9ACTN|nr:GNAT family N-acetyltransferase [Nocardioides daedukensis]NYG58576.1 ribosomal protein S18 acetylase RimI-like enzyme [Nocardioides daedukensis]
MTPENQPTEGTPEEVLLPYDDNRFESDPGVVLPDDPGLPVGWTASAPDPGSIMDVRRLTELLRAHEDAGRGWAGASQDDVLVEVSEHGLKMRENLVVRDRNNRIRAWASVHDRSVNRMLYVHIIERDLSEAAAERCSQVMFAWAEAQACEVGAARGLKTQQIDTGAFADDERQHKMLEDAGFNRVRTWWQMSRPVTADEASLVPDPEHWERKGVVFRQVRREGDGLPDIDDLRAVHDVLESSFTDHFNSSEETFQEFVHRLREDPGHRWDHWWIAEIVDGEGAPEAAGVLVGTVSESSTGPDGSYVSYLGVLESARGRGVATGLLRTIIADAAARDRDRVGLEVDADSSTGADQLYVGMGWKTKYVTESWHKDVPVG